MNYKLNKMAIIIVVALVFATTSIKAAVFCGMSVTSDVVLERNLYCDSSGVGFALQVAAENITIDLNGFRIFGDDAGVGIEVNAGNGFVLLGNGGSITNFERAVDMTNVSEAFINGVTFYKNHVAGVINKAFKGQSKGNQYTNNLFIYGEYGINLENHPDAETTAQIIDDNQFYQVGINIELRRSADNVVSNNFIWQNQRAGIVLIHSDHNQIYTNTILDSRSNAIEVSNSAYNKITGNNFDGGVFGMFLVSVEAGGGCTAADVSEFNEVKYNYFFNFDYGVYLRPFFCGEVRFNQVNQNKIYHNEVGVYLREVQNNDLTGNGFADTVVPFLDLSDGSNDY